MTDSVDRRPVKETKMGLITMLRGLRGWALPAVMAAAVVTVAGPASAQLGSATNSVTGASCGGGSNGDGDCQNSVVFTVPNNGSNFTSRYAWNINADTGVGSTRDESGNAQHNISFTATAPGSYQLNISTTRVGDINRVSDIVGCDGSADTSGINGTSNIALASGSLSLADPGSLGNGGGTNEVPFGQSGSAVIGPRLSNGAAQSHTLTFTWNGSVRSNSCEAAVRQGESSGNTSGCSACGYAGSPSRTQATDGQFVTVSFTSFCGNGTVDGTGEQCDEGGANGASTSCCTSTCQFRAAGQTCRTSAGICDVVETCTGSSATCPADGFASNATVCRAAAGECDQVENCPGNAAACPADAKKVNGTACTADANPCTLDQCNGS